MGPQGWVHRVREDRSHLWRDTVTVDEVQDASHEELRALGNEIQLLIRRGANVAFAFAGLPFSVDGVVNGRGLTFLQRAKQVWVGAGCPRGGRPG